MMSVMGLRAMAAEATCESAIVPVAPATGSYLNSAASALASSCGRGGHLPEADNQREAVTQLGPTFAGLEPRETPLEPRAPALEPRGHPFAKGCRRVSGNGLRHHREAAGGKRQEQRRANDVFADNRNEIVDRDRIIALEQRIERCEETVEISLMHGEQQFFLAREIEIDGTLAQSGLVGYLGDAGDTIGRAQQQALRRIEDRAVALLLVDGLDCALADDHEISAGAIDCGSID
jgi:hypothetical protein